MSATLVGTVRGLFAVGVVDDSADFSINRGFTSCEHTGTGIYTFLLQDSVSLSDSACVLAQPYGLVSDFPSGLHCVVIQDDANFEVGAFVVRVYAGGTLTDPDFMSVQVQDVNPV